MQSAEPDSRVSSQAADTAATHQQPGSNDNPKAPEDITPPRVTHRVVAKIPKEARTGKYSAVVTIGLIIDVNGNPTKVHVVRSAAEANLSPVDHAAALSLDQSALDAVSKYRFVPAKRNGTPVAVVLNVEVNFQLW